MTELGERNMTVTLDGLCVNLPAALLEITFVIAQVVTPTQLKRATIFCLISVLFHKVLDSSWDRQSGFEYPHNFAF
jgi:hypothetical protein